MPTTTIGVLTAGGDCPGLNAVIRAVAKPLLHEGFRVVGIEDGFRGLIEDRTRPLGVDEVSGILAQGGTILGSCNKSNPRRFATGLNPDGSPRIEDVTGRCVATAERHGIDALIVIGGDGSMSCACELREGFAARGRELRLVGVPKTIDNDLWGTEVTFGFQTAVATAAGALDRVRTTAESHHRAMVVEVMGRNAGWIALHAGLAGGAEVILIPEIPFDLDVVARVVKERAGRGRRYSMIGVSEGARPIGGAKIVAKVDPTSPDPIRLGGVGKFVADEIERRSGVESRYVVLGHLQRGGTPEAFDRVLATAFGHHAAGLVASGRWGRVAVMSGGRVTDIPIEDTASRQRLVPIDDPTIAAARAVYTSFGVA
ncbi:MAG: 6-phosphofructokinase [Phycisphaeraceae bacterium]|nr:MAG: 6-phosphofructokinase [Phycisphaeraceae bacterium]